MDRAGRNGIGCLVFGIIVLAMTACASSEQSQRDKTAATVLPAHDTPGYGSIQRGRYLVKAGDCAACHTAKDGQPFAGGYAVLTPFGTIYSTNITPDKDTGIGSWSEADFYRAMHTGTDAQGNHLYPAFPYPWFTKVTTDDVRDIKAYLDTLKPVRQLDREDRLPWPMTDRAVMAVWNKLYFDAGAFVSNPKKSAEWNRGAYLVEGLGHCGACHTAKNFAGAPKGDPLHGGLTVGSARPGILGRWSRSLSPVGSFAPSLAGGLRDGLGGWSAAEIVEYLKTGSNDKTSAAGQMAQVVTDSTQYLSDDDLADIATYLKDMPGPRAESASNHVDKNALARGAAVYADDCTGCHMDNGQGLAHVFPPLRGSAAVQAESPDTMVRVVLAGGMVPATTSKPTGFKMPAFDEKLDDAQIADVVSYIRNAWGNDASVVSTGGVTKVRADLKQKGAGG